MERDVWRRDFCVEGRGGGVLFCFIYYYGRESLGLLWVGGFMCYL